MKLISILIILLILPTVISFNNRTELPEERRIFKVGPTSPRWLSCNSQSMGKVLSCHKYYWAFMAKPGDARIGDIASYKTNYEMKKYYGLSRNIGYITHRIINITDDGCYVFKGDANPAPDPFCIKKVISIYVREEPYGWKLRPD